MSVFGIYFGIYVRGLCRKGGGGLQLMRRGGGVLQGRVYVPFIPEKPSFQIKSLLAHLAGS